MYQQFKNRVLAQLDGIDQETLQKVSRALDKASNGFEFTQAETALTVYNDGLPDPCKAYLVTRKIEGLSAGTLNLYKLRLTDFFKTVQKPLEKITANDIRLYLYTYQEQHGTSNRTLDGIKTAIKTFFGWAAAEEYISTDPARTIKPIKYEARHRDALTQMELEIVRHSCIDLREKALVEFLYSTGCRVSEVTNAKISDIDWAKTELVVLGKGNKHRTVYLNSKAVITLKEYLLSRKDNTDAIFAQCKAPYMPLSRRAIENIIDAISDRANLSKPLTPHIFRHTNATVALQAGMPVQDVSRILGHARIDTTMIYAEVNESDISEEHRKYVV